MSTLARSGAVTGAHDWPPLPERTIAVAPELKKDTPPASTTFGSAGSTAIASTLIRREFDDGRPVLIAVQWAPPSVDLKMPFEAVPA